MLGLAWVIGTGLLTLAPALHHGLSLGPYDILSQSGLTRASGVTVRNTESGDQIAQMIPWSTLAWTQVHQGHLPLWNPFNGLGLPLAFNWQSAAFSLPAAVSYLFPLHLAYTAQIIVTLVVAGTGAYALGGVLRLGVIGCATAGTVYQLSGSFMGWLGWPHAAVMSWAGWLLAVGILIVRGRHRTRNIVALAVMLALALVSGQPELFTILTVSVVVVVLTMLILTARASHHGRSALRPLLDLVLAVAAGLALGAPLALPGLQVLAKSTRNSGALLATTEVGHALPPHDLVHLLVQGYNGLPVAGGQVFGDAVYFDTAAYVGVIAIALAILGVVRGRRRPEVVALLVLAVVSLAIVFAPPVEAVLIHLPFVQTIDWHRDLMGLSLCVALLAGVGMDALVRGTAPRSNERVLAAALGAQFVLLVALWLFVTSGLSPLDAGQRRDSLTWGLVSAGLGLVLVGALAGWRTRTATGQGRAADPAPLSHRRVVAGLLLVVETAFLVSAGAQLWSSSPHGATPTPAVTALADSVGEGTVGFGAFTCYDGPAVTSLGILPEANSLFDVHQFDFYDPVLPTGYFQAWSRVSPSKPGVPIYNSFCPAITTASEARQFGVAFVLEPAGAAGPTGAVFDRRIGDEDLYRIPDSGAATLTPVTATGGFPPAGAPAVAVAVTHPSPSSWRIVTGGPGEQVLRLGLTDLPGWRATIDGHPLQVTRYAGVMLQARIPAGHHVIELHYWPSLFTVGLIAAAGCAVLLITASVIAVVHRRRDDPT